MCSPDQGLAPVDHNGTVLKQGGVKACRHLEKINPAGNRIRSRPR